MTPFAAVAAKGIGAAGFAVLLGMGAVSASTGAQSSTGHTDRRAVRAAVVEAEADVLGIKPEQLIKDLKAGQKVSDLARDRGISKDQFADRLAVNLKPRLEALVDRKVITQAQADKLVDRIAHGYVPFWDGIHHRKK